MSWPAAELVVAGGRLSLSPLPDSQAAVDGLVSAGVGLVLSLTEPYEEPAGFAGLLQRSGLVQRRWPIRDYGVPEGDLPPFADVLALLRAGGHVALHCRGGCGRSGMVALWLMRAAGEEGQAALQRLRAARPCAIETPGQLAWALAD